jgi:hypothetical protein
MRKIVIGVVAVFLLLVGGAVWLHGQGTPTVGQLQATPGIVIVNTPTSVKFTIPISDPSVISTGVNLLRLSATGAQSVVATMHDDGIGGDTTAGDKMFSAVLTLNESQVGTFNFQASAAFRGQLKRAPSNTLQYAVLGPITIPVNLPPDPGDAGKVPLAGIDADGDGVRDDIERYVVFAYPGSEKTRSALMNLAIADQNFFLLGSTPSLALTQVTRALQAKSCLYFILGGVIRGQPVRHALEAALLNTHARSLAFTTVDESLIGQTFAAPTSSDASSCPFDIATMRN